MYENTLTDRERYDLVALERESYLSRFQPGQVFKTVHDRTIHNRHRGGIVQAECYWYLNAQVLVKNESGRECSSIGTAENSISDLETAYISPDSRYYAAAFITEAVSNGLLVYYDSRDDEDILVIDLAKPS